MASCPTHSLPRSPRLQQLLLKLSWESIWKIHYIYCSSIHLLLLIKWSLIPSSRCAQGTALHLEGGRALYYQHPCLCTSVFWTCSMQAPEDPELHQQPKKSFTGLCPVRQCRDQRDLQPLTDTPCAALGFETSPMWRRICSHPCIFSSCSCTSSVIAFQRLWRMIGRKCMKPFSRLGLFLQHLARPISCFQHAVPWQCALIPYEVRKSLHSCHFQFLPKRNTSYKGSAHYSWIINEAWYFREVQIGGILHIVRIPILFSWYVVPSAARRPRRCGHSPEITSALHYRYHISIIYTLSDKWKCFHKNNLESWLKTQVCCQDKQSSLKEDLFLFCSDKYVVSGL